MMYYALAKKLALLHYYGFDLDGSCYTRRDLKMVEALTHELAHALVAGMKIVKTPPSSSSGRMSRAVESHMKAMSHRGSDEQECRAIAVEVIALAMLGLHVNSWRLATYASQGMKCDLYDESAMINVRRIRDRVRMYMQRPSTLRHAERLVRIVEGLTP